jgi:flagellar protein FlgJ
MIVEGQIAHVMRPDGAPNLKVDKDSTSEEIKDAAKQFEAYFLKHLLQEMRATVPESGLWKEGFANDVYNGMLDEQYASLMADHGGIGLAAVLERQLTKQAASTPSPDSGQDLNPLK